MFHKSEIWRLPTFIAVGLVTTSVSYLVFVPLSPVIGWLPAAAAAWVPSVAVGFLLNRRLTFNIRGHAQFTTQMKRYFVTALFQLGLSIVGFHLLIDVVGLGVSRAFFINLAITTGFSFLCMRFFTFRRNLP